MLRRLKSTFVLEAPVVIPRRGAGQGRRTEAVPPLRVLGELHLSQRYVMRTTLMGRISSLLDLRSLIRCGNAYVPDIGLYMPHV